jgi:hypothetical protein
MLGKGLGVKFADVKTSAGSRSGLHYLVLSAEVRVTKFLDGRDKQYEPNCFREMTPLGLNLFM